MMSKLYLFRYVNVALAVSVGLEAQGLGPTPLDRPALIGDAIAVYEDGKKWLACRVVDGITGQPIAAAEVLLFAEAATPVAAELPVAMRFEADGEGYVAGRVDAAAEGYRPWSWICARAPGYGQCMEMASFESPIVRLSPGGTISVQVRDWRDRPVEGALVGFCSGCGHTPDLVHGRTDATGRLTLAGVDVHSGIADFYLVHPDLDLGYLSPSYFPGRAPLVLRTGPGIVHRGVVVDASGDPVAGAAVGIATVHRGPWARTAADGSFTLCGLSEPTDLWVHVGGRRVLFEEDGVDAMRLQLPSADGDDEEGVQVMDLTDAQRERRDRGRDREEERAAAGELAWPTAQLRVDGLPEDGTVTMRTRSRIWDLSEVVAAGEPTKLPDEEFVFWLIAEGSARAFQGDRRAAEAAGVVELAWFAPTSLSIAVVEPSGAEIPARAFVGEPGSSPPEDRNVWQALRDEAPVQTSRSGPSWIFLEPVGRQGRRVLEVDLPPRGEAVAVDVGAFVVPEAPLYRFERYDGSPLVEGEVTLTRAGWTSCDGGWDIEPDEQGHIWLPALLPGDALLVRSELPWEDDSVELVELPSRFVIGAQPPAVFRMHGGEARLEVDAGEETAYATFGDQVVALDGPTVVRGLARRDYWVLLGAYGKQGVRVRVDLSGPDAPPAIRVALR
jgi:hypothetical protein